MNVRDLNVGDVFKLTSPHGRTDPHLWRKDTHHEAQAVGAKGYVAPLSLTGLSEHVIEVVERADTAPIRRSGDTLVLNGGDVLLRRWAPFTVYRCTPGEKFTELILTGHTFDASKPDQMGPEVALGFVIRAGAKALGRPNTSMVFAYKGRVYARATNQEVRGKATTGGYKHVTKVDGARRLHIAGMLTIADDCALFDIIQEHFGMMEAPRG